MKRSAILYALFFLACGVVPAVAQIKPQPSEADARRRVRLACSPRELFRGDTLKLEMTAPHGRDLAVIGPGDDYYFLKSWEPEDKEATADWFAFERQPTLDLPTLTTVGEWTGMGDPRWERVFNKTGWYEIRISYNLETDDGTPFQTCRVHYTDTERAVGVAAPFDAGEVRGADQLEAALNQYEQLGRELAAARTRADAEAEREVGEKIRTGPKDEFETTAEYNARNRKAARLLAEARARREQSLSKELAEADRKQGEILARRYVAKVNAFLDPYDADLGAFTLAVDDAEDPLFTLPIPRDEARELKADLDGVVFEGVYRLSFAPPLLRPEPHLMTVRATSRGKVYETATRAPAPTRKAEFVRRPEPGFTEVARHNNVSGTVRLRVLLRTDGVAKVLRVVKGLPDGLTEKAVEAAERVTFRPAERYGRPVSSVVTLEYNFNIY